VASLQAEITLVRFGVAGILPPLQCCFYSYFSKGEEMKKVYIECSMLAAAPDVNTGIQRVVRHILKQAQMIGCANDFNVMAVDLSFGQFVQVDARRLYPSHKSAQSKGFASRSLTGVKGLLRRLLRLCESYPVLVALLYRTYISLRRYKRRLCASSTAHGAVQSVLQGVSQGDHLIILDASWTRDIWSSVRQFKARGGYVTVVVYDLIPLTHPAYCEPDHKVCFEDWIDHVAREADRCVGISRFVRDEVKAYLQARSGAHVAQSSFFYLGADLMLPDRGVAEPRQELRQAFRNQNTYIVVSTIEPRKNHALIVDAFDQLWGLGHDVSLVVIGRPGWKTEALLKRISQHQEYGNRLHHYADLADSELVWCYRNARALVFASHIEGFGLPLIEAMHHGLPVLASDIPIHHEVAGDRAHYFSPQQPESLCQLVAGIESGELELNTQHLQQVDRLTWEQSCRMLLIESGVLPDSPVL